jgi:hypothetical protein
MALCQVRRKLLWAAGMKDLSNVPPGQGNTQHCFNDHNHWYGTCMYIATRQENHQMVRLILLSCGGITAVTQRP